MANHDETAIEAEIQSKNMNAPRLNPAHIDSVIASEYWGRASDLFKGCPTHSSMETLTICVLVLKNGFTVVGESACASAANYDPEIGAKIARDNARNKIWALEGYALRSKLAG